MADKRRRSRSGKKAAYTVRPDQRSDPKPKSKIARKLAKLTPPPKCGSALPGATGREPDRLLYAYDEQKAMEFADTPDIARVEAQPFLKWAGGKTSLLVTLDEFLPAEVERYVEPFLGGGAVFFHLKRRFPHLRAFLRDSNEELINAYRNVRDRTEELMQRLDVHAAAYRKGGDDYYYEVRGQQNLPDNLERAARTIFLNKTCFNGLYRVNAKGEFNTPVGSAKNPSLYNRDNLLAAAWALRDAELEAKDFRETVEEARRGDLVYFDPPYFPISEYSDFKRYTSGQFREPDHVELARAFRVLDQRGCYVVLSNSDHPRIRELYVNYPIRVVQAPRMINCKGDRRGDIAGIGEPHDFGCAFGGVTLRCGASLMKQHEAVIEVMRANGGFATLGRLYHKTLKIPGVEWKTKTPFKSINRIVQDDRFFFRIRPGLWALKECKDSLPPEIKDIDKPEYNHTYYQGLVVELGNLKRFETFVPPQDRGRKFSNKPLGDAATLQQLHPFTFPEVVKRALSVDVIWFNPRRMPSAFFEIEHTTSFDNSLLKFVHFQDFKIDFRIVAAKDRQKEYAAKISHPSFAPIATRTKFTSYELVSELHAKAHEVAGLENQWAA